MPLSEQLSNQLRDIVGRERYLDTPTDTASYGYNSFPLHTEPAAVFFNYYFRFGNCFIAGNKNPFFMFKHLVIEYEYLCEF